MALAVGGGLLWLRFKRPDLKRPFKAWVPAVILRISLSLALLAAPFFPPKVKPSNGLFYATYAIVGVSMFVPTLRPSHVWLTADQLYKLGCRRGLLVRLDRFGPTLERLQD